MGYIFFYSFTLLYVLTLDLTMSFYNLFIIFQQTDPNWSNFLFDEGTKTINLIDFGAAREYPQRFVDDYLRMVSSLYVAVTHIP